MTRPDVDVLIPVFNGAAYIRGSIESIQRQTLSSIAIHVVDDGSTDATAEILEEMRSSDPRIEIHSKSNGGIVDALNHGLQFCTAEFVARHDADDLASPSRLASQVDLLRRRPEVAATGGAARHIDSHDAFMGTYASFGPTSSADPTLCPAKEPYLLHPFLLIRRDALMKVNGYRYVLHAEDADLYWRLQEHGELFNDHTVYGDYRIHADSISSRSISNGRALAFSSQMSALSAIRRRTGKADLSFSRELSNEIKAAATSMEALSVVAARSLTQEESRHLRLSAALKLVETADYRPYELESADCVFLRKAFDESAATLTPSNRALAHRMISGTAARLASEGRAADAAIMLQPSMRPAFVIRLISRKLLSPRIRRMLRRMRSREAAPSVAPSS